MENLFRKYKPVDPLYVRKPVIKFTKKQSKQPSFATTRIFGGSTDVGKKPSAEVVISSEAISTHKSPYSKDHSPSPLSLAPQITVGWKLKFLSYGII